MLRILTAGESHGRGLVGVIEGLPSNVPLKLELINQDLRRRQQGYGRGGRMKIEKDQIEVMSGIRGGKTLGSPISFVINNRDYDNWREHMDPFQENKEERRVTRPRPGHADLTGQMKYNFDDIRNVLERSSARETAVRTAAGSIVKQFLKCFNIEVYSHVVSIGDVQLNKNSNMFFDTQNSDDLVKLIKKADESPVRCIDQETEAAMIQAIDEAKADGDSLGGVFEVHITGVPVGLGSYVQWDRKLDAKLSYALMSIQGIKGVEIGEGFTNTTKPGSQVHDEIYHQEGQGYHRKTNFAGGIEGGMSNGETIILRCGMKPIPTLYKPLRTVNIHTKEVEMATVERSDTCAVPAASIVGEMVAISVIGEEFMRKFGGDSLEEIMKRWKDYI
ncbi:chorismate synthase [Alkaliphilus hydrothermalis]|uniref:Chorismate synthase n=1 Tax=Alkaliphilus hydrothermalis TaxID=1482730 RepID=A0ABS2NLB2_9FIRM|nr:chorismate synthase [Alkaliphilus hydrothermalis]MBM7613733.1 chorismate synthase [Alkaliphilus hydrothermalis]